MEYLENLIPTLEDDAILQLYAQHKIATFSILDCADGHMDTFYFVLGSTFKEFIDTPSPYNGPYGQFLNKNLSSRLYDDSGRIYLNNATEHFTAIASETDIILPIIYFNREQEL